MRKVKLIIHETYQGKRKSEDVFAAVFLSPGYDPLDEWEEEKVTANVWYGKNPLVRYDSDIIYFTIKKDWSSK